MKARLWKNIELDEPFCYDENQGWLSQYDEEKVYQGYVICDTDGYIYWAGNGGNKDIMEGIAGTPISHDNFKDYDCDPGELIEI